MLVVFSRAGAEIYLWPMHGARRLSSSFGEYREGHYHAGIDLRSYGEIGLPCLAVADGSVSRIKIAPAGYGKALYLKLSDGRTAVYAHLDGFNQTLDSLAWHHRIRGEKSWCDLHLPPGTCPFSVGDTVCYSGTSGTPAPHLHFELRDESGRPFNPLEEIYSIEDRTPPLISGLEVIPRWKGSRINGSPFPQLLLLRASRGNRYLLPDTLHLEGGFSFGVSVWDVQGYGRYPMAPLAVEITVDGESLYTLQNSLFSYAQAGEVNLEYEIFGPGPAGRYTLLYRKEGITREDRSGPGLVHAAEDHPFGLRMSKGLHRGEIKARDASGNESRAVFYFCLHSLPVIEKTDRLEAAPEVILSGFDPDGGTVRGRLLESLDGGYSWRELPVERRGSYERSVVSERQDAVFRYLLRDDEGAEVSRYFASPPLSPEPDNVFCEMALRAGNGGMILDIITDRMMSALPVVEKLAAQSLDTVRVYQEDLRRYSAPVEVETLTDGLNIFRVRGLDHRGYPLESVKAFTVHLVPPGEPVRWQLGDTLDIRLVSRSINLPLACLSRDTALPGRPPEGMKHISSPFDLEFEPQLFTQSLEMLVDTSRNTGLFYWKDDREWKCLGVPAMNGGKVKIEHPGTYIFLQDPLPPRIEHVALEDHPSGSGFFKDFQCCLPVREEGSGIDPYSAEAFLNGKRMVCEWDEFRQRLYIPVPRSFTAGPVKLKVEISDLAGNRSVEEFGFMLR